jgi:hypothetical protein
MVAWYQHGLIKSHFTLDEQTVARIGKTAARLGISKSQLVREAVREYAARVGRQVILLDTENWTWRSRLPPFAGMRNSGR